MNSPSGGFFRSLLITLAAFSLLIALSVIAVNRISETNAELQAQTVLSSVRRAMLACYAVEGAYPLSLDYLKENYALHYNEERFFVFYDAFASNVMPEVRVNVRGRAE